MTDELGKSYHGVLCIRCGQPISVSPKIVTLQSEFESGATTALGTFLNRCRVCELESRYWVADVRVFPGGSQASAPKARAGAA